MTRVLLVPTRFELENLPHAPSVADTLAGNGRWRGFEVGLAGFGPVDAGIGAMSSFGRFDRIELCVLAGLAGTLEPAALPVGAVCEGAAFQLHGIGLGVEPDLVSLEGMGLPAEAAGALPLQSREEATARLALDGVPSVELLTVCVPSRDGTQAEWRRARYPAARAEEMEAYAVARAARIRAVPFACLRAVSNVAGDRDRPGWDVRRAMAALVQQLEEV